MPVYSGNPYNPMNILVTSISIDDQKLEAGDEIGVFDGSICVGSTTYKGEEIIGIAAAMDDPGAKEKDGFKFGNPISFRIWKHKIDFEYIKVDGYFNSFFDTVFYPLGTALVELKSDIKEQVPIILPDQSFSVEENSVPNTSIGQLKVDFPQGKLSYTILHSGPNFPFCIDSLGVISVKNTNLFDYTENNTCLIPVTAYYTGNIELSDTAICKIEIIRIPPDILSVNNDTAVVGSSYKQIIKISNPTNKFLSLVPSNIPSWLTIRLQDNKEIIFEGIPTLEDIGTSEVSFLLSDKINLVQKGFLLETVRKSNTPNITLLNNPTYGPFRINFYQFEENCEIEIRVKNMSGLVVYRDFIINSDNTFDLNIDLSGKARNIYLVEVKYKNILLTKKLLLQ